MDERFNTFMQSLHKKQNNSYYQLQSSLEPDFWDVYPRPQMKRDNWQCLNGIWKIRGREGDKNIRVPFPPQAELSGYECPSISEIPEEMLYERNFVVDPALCRKKDNRILLHFGAVDQVAQVFVNGKPLCTHEGGYLPFYVDITDALRPDRGAENSLSVFVQDHLDDKYPRGKQRKDRGGMWYTPCSGIWQTVWLESVPANHITEVRFTPLTLTAVRLEVYRTERVPDAGQKGTEKKASSDVWEKEREKKASSDVWEKEREKKVSSDGEQQETNQNAAYSICVNEEEIAGILQKADHGENLVSGTKAGQKEKQTVYTAVIDLTDYHPHLWTQDDPYLYPIEITLGEDKVSSYFALRTVEIRTVNGKKWICLNQKPVFLSGVLDQGYFCDGLFLPANPKGYEDDILGMKNLGFHMIRKHIKIEPEQFYYDCDRLGMLVMQDMVNNGPYSFFADTVLPGIGWKKHPRRSFEGGTRKQREVKAYFRSHSADTIRHLYSHPCIIAWTVFNEGWGQFDSDRVGEELAVQDPTRFFDYTSGWFKGKNSPVESVHEYYKLGVMKQKEKPLLLTECGGYCLPVENHKYAVEDSYGYGTCKDSEELTGKILNLYETMIYPSIAEGLGGFVYTQVSDVEDEVNGFYTYDRMVLKVDPETMRKAHQKADELLERATEEKKSQ